jgi:hypothetical protein
VMINITARPLYLQQQEWNHRKWSCVGSRSCLEGCKKLTTPGLEPRIVQPIAGWYTDYEQTKAINILT